MNSRNEQGRQDQQLINCFLLNYTIILYVYCRLEIRYQFNSRQRQGENATASHGAEQGLSVSSVLVADDHPLVREHLAEAIRTDDRLEFAGEAGDGAEALLKVEKQRPDLVVLDIAMPVLDGAAVLKRLRERCLPIRVLLLSGHADVVQMRNALRYRPDSLLLMDVNAGGICEELVALKAEGVLSPGRLNLERAQLLARNRVELSGRELEVLKLSAEGLTRTEIGKRLRFGSSTVRDIRHDICTKLGAPSMQVAIVLAMRTGMLEVGPRHSMDQPSTY